jgi:hypothetical protein
MKTLCREQITRRINQSVAGLIHYILSLNAIFG